jgi:hypothetical protein
MKKRSGIVNVKENHLARNKIQDRTFTPQHLHQAKYVIAELSVAYMIDRKIGI